MQKGLRGISYTKSYYPTNENVSCCTRRMLLKLNLIGMLNQFDPICRFNPINHFYRDFHINQIKTIIPFTVELLQFTNQI